ncbi:hypothetical protein HDA36_000310 [Nocardiopsis composta]|uniref:Uncharacterized protein n=1 Tax=Nocardiopsis composta TaxID=157465 RepID=A0A7W8VBD6_9ACTN|nr:hypothetical protein [Nocardiopsis composta]
MGGWSEGRHPGAAPHGVGVQASSDGGRDGAGVSVGCGISRSTGSHGRRRRRKGRGRACLPGAASRGAGAKAGGDGAGRDGVRCAGRVRGVAERGLKPAATAEGGTGWRRRPTAAPRGVQVQTGSDGAGGDRAGHACRARHPAKRGLKPAATAGVDRGLGASAGRGASRSGGSNRQQRQEQGEGRISSPGLRSGRGRAEPAGDSGPPPRRERKFRLNASESSAGTEDCRLPVRLLGGPNDVYRRVASSQAQAPSSRSPRVAKTGAAGGGERGIAPSIAPSRFPAPVLPPFGRPEPLSTTPIGAQQPPGDPIRLRMRSPPSWRRRPGVQGASPTHHPPYSCRSGRFR